PRGYWCLSDSNYDWGQGLKELAAWRQRHNLDSVDVWYFGTDPTLRTPGFHYLPLHQLPIREPQDVASRAQGRYLAVSTTLRFGSYGMTKQDADPVTALQRAAEILRSCQPVDRTTTFFIYDFTDIAALPNAPGTQAAGPRSSGS